MRNILVFVLMILLLGACSVNRRIAKLPEHDYQHYQVFRSFLGQEGVKHFVKFKTSEQRDAFLKEKGLWDMFYKYSDEERQAIVDGEVTKGWTKDRVLMAWGAPYDKRALAGRKAMRSELLVYRFESAADGTIRIYEPGSKTVYKAVRRFSRRLILDDDKVVELEEVNAWE
jgi:hypothetical protein